MYAIQRNEKIWTRSDEFDPDRFKDEQSKAINDHYMPFAVGRRMYAQNIYLCNYGSNFISITRCLGNNFSIVEGKVVISQLCSQFTLKLAPSYRFEVEQMATLRPRGGLLLEVQKRK